MLNVFHAMFLLLTGFPGGIFPLISSSFEGRSAVTIFESSIVFKAL